MYLLRKKISLWTIAVVALNLVTSQPLGAQEATDHDTSYYKAYPRHLLGRFYFSRKYTNVVLGAPRNEPRLRYRPNTTLNMGVGATYRGFTLNLAYGFPFLNQNSDRGKTRYLDLQSHLYTRKWSYDFWGQLYKGYYLRSDWLKDLTGDRFYLRPDIGVTLLGFSTYHILQNRTFSYRATFIQDEWQVRSAGSWLIGGEMYYGRVSADSAFVPELIGDGYGQKGVEKLRFMDFGPGIGYAYNWVYQKNLFMGLAATINLNLGFVKESGEGVQHSQITFSPNFIYRATAGYNSEKWTASLSLVGNRVSTSGANTSYNYVISTGNYRATLAYRFLPGKKIKKVLEPLDRLKQ